jgi:integrase/recombinase XerC
LKLFNLKENSVLVLKKYRNKLIIDLFYTTGIRRTELIHLRIDVDLSKAIIKV